MRVFQRILAAAAALFGWSKTPPEPSPQSMLLSSAPSHSNFDPLEPWGAGSGRASRHQTGRVNRKPHTQQKTAVQLCKRYAMTGRYLCAL